MFNPDSIKYPPNPAIGQKTHKASETLFFIIGNEPPATDIKFNRKTQKIEQNEEFAVLDHAVGYRGKWTKIRNASNVIGFVMTEGIEALEGTKPFFPSNVEGNALPDPTIRSIDWTKQQPMIVYEDENQGAYVVHYELEQITGYKDKAELYNNMIFARKEGTKLILQHVGKIADEETLQNLLEDYYAFSRAEEYYIDPRPCSTLRVAVAIPKKYLQASSKDLIDEPKTTSLPFTEPVRFSRTTPETTPPTELYFTLSFENFDKYEEFFNKLIELLKFYDITFKSKSWAIEPPEIEVNFKQESDNVKKLHDSINDLINKNYPKFVRKEMKDIFSAPIIKWENSLDLVFDKKTISLVRIKYYNKNVVYKLTNSFTNFLNSEETKNKTTINYLLAGPEVFSGSIPSSFQDENIKTFLTTKHYPKISNISAQPIDLFNCTIDTVNATNDILSVQLPRERARYELLNKQYEAAKAKKEGDIFVKSLTDLSQVKDKNFRVLFGIDPPKGNNSKQQFNNFIAVAKSLDWAKFLGNAAQCLSVALPPAVIAELLLKYQEARKFLENMLLSSVCNPYIKNNLNIIRGFELPVIPTYNPQQSLADELERAILKLLNDLIAIGIKQALKAASGACLRDPNANFNGSNAPTNPILPASEIKDPELNNLLDDFYSGTVAPDNGVDSREAARTTLNNLISDITACLSLQELCKLYKGESLNDEVYQLIMSLVKRKYGSPYTEKFSSRQYIIDFFRRLGGRLDLTLCEDSLLSDEPQRKINILCDDGKVEDIRRRILSDKGLTPEMIDDVLENIKAKETKNLDDILKILNSDNPFDFSSVPDIRCKLFPDSNPLQPSEHMFNQLMKSMFKTAYDNFDREARDWYKTTYSISNPSKPQLLEFSNNQLKVKENIEIPLTLGDSIRANSGKASTADQENNSNNKTGIEEVKLPFYMFKNVLKKAKTSDIINYIELPLESINRYYVYLDGDVQQKLDVNVELSQLKTQIQEGEALLGVFAHQFLFAINSKITAEALKATVNVAEGNSVLSSITPILDVIRAVDIYARSNIADSQDLTLRLNNLYKQLDFDSAQEANALFAAEEGAAIYLSVCAQLEANRQKIQNAISLTSQINTDDSAYLSSNFTNASNLSDLLDEVLTKYRTIVSFYKTILKIKISYPDYTINLQTNLNNINAFGRAIQKYNNGTLYDFQRLIIAKNNKNYIKATTVSTVDSRILDYITSSLKIQDLANKNKQYIFNEFIKNSIEKYGLTPAEISEEQKIPSNSAYANILSEISDKKQFIYLNEKVFDGIKNRIINKDNKFLYLKETININTTVVAESGGGQPYTQFLKLVVPQTQQQKACGIRPNYLDIDSILNKAAEERKNTTCTEQKIDEKILNNEPINSREIENIEADSTQKIMLSGGYRLALRAFLHDILLRGVAIFGRYDPQSLRDEPAFIDFMSNLAESEIRGMDNIFFNMMSNFFFEKYKNENPDEVIENELLKKKEIFRILVKKELTDYVLPKLAKRIDFDTNDVLYKNIPQDNLIKLINIADDVYNLDILRVENKAVFLKLKGKGNFEQKIYENLNSSDDNSLRLEFLSTIEYEFLFKYIFPLTQVLNYFFILNCMSTSTRRQIIQAFRDTKKDLMNTCKIISTNGQPIINNPNNAQSTAEDDVSRILLKFVLESLVKTPIKIIKGMAEGSEPNIALTSTVYKTLKTVKPDLTSLIIPATSIPLGTIPTPITCPLPFINPILASVYFASLAWYDDDVNPLQKGLEDLEKSIGLPEVDCRNIKNEDVHYRLDLTTIDNQIDAGIYSLQASRLFPNIPVDELTPEFALEQAKQRLKNAVINTMLIDNEINNITTVSDKNKRDIITNIITGQTKEKYIVDSIYDREYNDALIAARASIKFLEEFGNLTDYIKSNFSFPEPRPQSDDNEASRKGGVYLDVWLFTGKPSTFAALEQLLDSRYKEYINKKLLLNGITNESETYQSAYAAETAKPNQTFKEWVRNSFSGIKFYGEA